MNPREHERSDGLDDLVELFNSGPEGKQAAVMIATVMGKRFDQEHTPARCPICQRFTPCPKHPEESK